jgi:flagellar biosynthetic protein FliR
MIELPAETLKFFLVFLRVLSVLFLIPLFSLRQVSFLFKVGFSLALSNLIYDRLDLELPSSPPFVSISGEVLLGLLVGFLVRVVFAALSMAGEIASLQSGFSFSRSIDPYSEGQTSLLVELKYLLAMLLFFAIDGHHVILKSLYESFSLVPLGGFSLNEGVYELIVRITGSTFAMALKIGSPLVVSLFLIEVSLGILSRLVPQMNVFLEGIPVKILASISILSLSLGLISPLLTGLFFSLEGNIASLFRGSG